VPVSYIDIDECEINTGSCPDVTRTCVNTPGSFMCVCADGYIKKNGQCEGQLYGTSTASDLQHEPRTQLPTNRTA